LLADGIWPPVPSLNTGSCPPGAKKPVSDDGVDTLTASGVVEVDPGAIVDGAAAVADCVTAAD